MDYTLIGNAYNNTVRIYVSNTKNLVQKAQELHATYPTSSAALGRLLTAGVMMGLMYKNNEKITLRFKCDGPIKMLLVEANGSGEVRGTLGNPKLYFKYSNGEKKGKLNVSKALGNGFFHLTKDLLSNGIYTSSSKIVSGEIAEDITYYFSQSEQTNSSVALGVLVNPDLSIAESGGFIIQLMPGATNHTVELLETILNKFTSITEFYSSGNSPEELFDLLSNNTGNIIKKIPVKYNCHCSKMGFTKSLKSLGKKTISEILLEDGDAEIICHFCNKKYMFNSLDLESIINN